MPAALALAGAALAVALAAPSRADAADRLVTFAARWCEDYPDISANRARNDIQESLRDLGPDTLYRAGETVAPDKELAGQPRCGPLPGWRFTLGRGYQTRAVLGPWGALARVTSPFDTAIVTQPSVPLLDLAGRDTGTTIAGAVTVALTDAQAALAARSSALWLQGGTPEDPVLDRLHPSQYGFGAVRCALDNLNGDNVEWIGFPSGARHVFCFAYYVRPPPTSGTIVVRKVVDDPQATAAVDFPFGGDVSYAAGHLFSLRAAYGQDASETFYRAATGPGDAPWTVRELPPPGYQLRSLSCSSGSGASALATDPADGTAGIRLAGGDTVTCTYVDRIAPPPATLQLSKTTIGGSGPFDFAVTGPGADLRQTLTTTAAGAPVAGEPVSLAPGAYAIDESAPPASAAGSWSLEQVTCDGGALAPQLPLALELEPGERRACQFVNRFQPAGALVLRKQTLGGVGSVGFAVGRDGDPAFGRWQSATTTAPGRPVRAAGDDLSGLPLGTYTIVETGPAPSARGEWSVEGIVCDGVPVASAQGRFQVTLTAARPQADCTVTDGFRAVPEPPTAPPPPVSPPETIPPPEATPPSPPPSGAVRAARRASRPRADLRIAKRVSPPVARPGRLVRYAIVVANRGPDAARNVIAVERGAPGVALLAARPSRGRCRRPARRRIVCRVASLPPGGRVVVRVLARAGRPGRRVDRVAVSTSTADRRLRDNRAHATLIVRRLAPRPHYTG